MQMIVDAGAGGFAGVHADVEAVRGHASFNALMHEEILAVVTATNLR
jgi:hypothetical protein